MFSGKFVLLLQLIALRSASLEQNVPKLVTVTVATEETDGLKRLRRTALSGNINLEVYGLGMQWQGGDTRIEQGGGQKILILREALEKYKNDKNLIVLFIDAYDVIFTGKAEEILGKFLNVYEEYRVVFAAEPFCWPKKTLAPTYPLVNFGYRYLNSGAFIGYVEEIWELLNKSDVQDDDDDQLYYTLLYLDDNFRESLKMTLDSKALLFQNLNGVESDIVLNFDKMNKKYIIFNTIYQTYPLIIHGNGPSKLKLNSIGNYVDNLRTEGGTCDFCEDNQIRWPRLTLAVLISQPIPFINEFLDNIRNLSYVEANIDLYIYCNQQSTDEKVTKFIKEMTGRYNSILFHDYSHEIGEREARQFSLKYALEMGSDFAFMIDGVVHLNNSEALKCLVDKAVKKKLDILAPMLRQPTNFFSNFWGAVASNGFYERSYDYFSIIDQELLGTWNVPHVNSAILISKEKIRALVGAFFYNSKLDPDISFCLFARYHGHFMYVDNTNRYGFLVVADDVEELKAHPDMYQIFANREIWEKKYIHPNYWKALTDNEEIPELCRDVYHFPLMSERFCNDLVGEMEHFGIWSNGNNQDTRLIGGYENVPTRDIHMKQIDFERHWLFIIDEYVRPIQEKLFIGYYKKPIESVMMFVVRYKPEEQASLRPHHDASTYSIDVALNKRDIDYEGGGVKFIRYNCTVAGGDLGYSMIFPGRLTHMHEGLPTTKGTRYIAVSFINP